MKVRISENKSSRKDKKRKEYKSRRKERHQIKRGK